MIHKKLDASIFKMSNSFSFYLSALMTSSFLCWNSASCVTVSMMLHILSAVRGRCWNIGKLMILSSLYILPIFSQSTNFSHLGFRSVDDFLVLGDTRYNADTLSFTINPSLFISRSFSFKVIYKDKVRMKKSKEVASFRTSFTFSVTQTQGQHFPISSIPPGNAFGFMFDFVTTNVFNSMTGNLAADRRRLKYFGVEFDTFRNAEDDDPSNNHIGVDVNACASAYTYNLCEDGRTSCEFPWTGQKYTAWIDFHAPTKSLEVWFTNGSLASGALKPDSPGLIKIPDLDLADVFEDFMFVGFSVNVGTSLDIHELVSWNFATYFEESDSTRISSKSWVKNVMIGTAAMSVVGISLVFGYNKRRVFLNTEVPELGLEHLMGLRSFSYAELKKATGSFSEAGLLGKGGSGAVYRGVLKVGRMVAVKRFYCDSEHMQREFLAEVSSISQIRHRNLVHLQGWCREGGHFLLVLDYMSNGSLDEWVFPSRRRNPRDPKYASFGVLPWALRFSILAGVAAAVEYLHEEWVQCVLHRDIKSSNVMLDADFSAHLGDFGLARLMDHEKLEKTTLMAGTLGYMAPEMVYTGKATKESDVYSFGVLVLEVVCGRRPVDPQAEDFLLVQSVWRAYECGNILSAVDPGLRRFSPPNKDGDAVNDEEERRVTALLQLGLQCCLTVPDSRPPMRVVKEVLLQVQSSTGDSFQSMPPLPPAMPLLGDLTASLAPHDAGMVSETLGRERELRRRWFVTN